VLTIYDSRRKNSPHKTKKNENMKAPSPSALNHALSFSKSASARSCKTFASSSSSPSSGAAAGKNRAQLCDEKINEFQSKTSLFCPPECGRCCATSENVEATRDEMKALALKLIEQGLGESFVGKLEKEYLENGNMKCAFYHSIDEKSGKGTCTVYEYRPAMCRLFGFSGRESKDGTKKKEFVGCEHMDREDVARAKLYVANGEVDVPIASHEARAMRSEAGADETLLPINVAAYEALTKAMFLRRMTEQQEEDSSGSSSSSSDSSSSGDGDEKVVII